MPKQQSTSLVASQPAVTLEQPARAGLPATATASAGALDEPLPFPHENKDLILDALLEQIFKASPGELDGRVRALLLLLCQPSTGTHPIESRASGTALTSCRSWRSLLGSELSKAADKDPSSIKRRARRLLQTSGPRDRKR
jgi:hypothetical protein